MAFTLLNLADKKVLVCYLYRVLAVTSEQTEKA